MKIIAVGKNKKSFSEQGIKYYQKQISKLEIIEVKQSTKEKETDLILSKVKQRDYVVGLAIEGKKYSSEEFATKLDQLKSLGSEIIFIIGGSTGLSDEVIARCNELISFSDLTFPHELFRLMLVEQIYRAESIILKKPYHK